MAKANINANALKQQEKQNRTTRAIMPEAGGRVSGDGSAARPLVSSRSSSRSVRSLDGRRTDMRDKRARACKVYRYFDLVMQIYIHVLGSYYIMIGFRYYM